MTKLIFEFDTEKVNAAGLTTDELLVDMRNYAEEKGITESSYGVFEKDGDSMALIGLMIPRLVRKYPNLPNYLINWTFDVDGELEDAKEALNILE